MKASNTINNFQPVDRDAKVQHDNTHKKVTIDQIDEPLYNLASKPYESLEGATEPQETTSGYQSNPALDAAFTESVQRAESDSTNIAVEHLKMELELLRSEFNELMERVRLHNTRAPYKI